MKSLGFHPVSNPCTAADFSSLSLNPGIKPQRWLLDKSMALPGRKSEFNLTRDEVRQLAACIKAKPEPQAISACWANILLGRAIGFQERGFAGVRPYETEGEAVLPAEQLRSMLSERPALAQEFAPLLDGCGLLGDNGTATLDPFHYWGLYEANHHGTLTLGAVYLLPLEDRYQLLDAQYYVSGTYYTFVTLYEVWPIQVEGKMATLVWRGDFFATPTLAYTRGAERLAYGVFMLQELKKTIRSFQNEILKPPVPTRTQTTLVIQRNRPFASVMCAALLALMVGSREAGAGSATISVTHELDARWSYAGNADTHGENARFDSGAEQSTYVRYVLSPQITRRALLHFGVEWERFAFGAPDGTAAPLPSTLQSISAVIGLDFQLNDKWLLRAEARPGVYSDFHDRKLDGCGFAPDL